MRPPIQYFGAKGNTADALVAMMPVTRGYVEPFCGSLAVLLARSPVKVEVVNDLDQRLMTFWRVLRDRPEDLVRVCALTPHARAEVLQAAELDATDDLELARQVFVMLTQGRSRTLRRTGWRFYADPSGTSAGFAQYLSAYLGRLAPAAARLADVSLECRPAIEVVEQYGAIPENLLYVDPPYVHSTLAGSSGSRYPNTMSDDEHKELLGALRDCRSKVVLSGYDSPIYEDLLGDWHVTRFGASTGNSTDAGRVESVWCNFEPENRFFA
jgi:DNA adenine methylase